MNIKDFPAIPTWVKIPSILDKISFKEVLGFSEYEQVNDQSIEIEGFPCPLFLSITVRRAANEACFAITIPDCRPASFEGDDSTPSGQLSRFWLNKDQVAALHFEDTNGGLWRLELEQLRLGQVEKQKVGRVSAFDKSDI